MAGSISLSLSQQFDSTGAPLNGGLLYFFAAGTTTPQSAYQDSSLTIAWPNPIVLDSAGRVPPFYLADGQIKIRLANSAGVTQVAADNLLVVGASSGSGSAPSVDATTILQTGDLKARYGTGAHTGWVRANGRTIGSATSGGTERANSDCQTLFEYLWAADTNLSVSTGRGLSANADWVANKNIALPDWRGRTLAALDDMGNSAAGRLTASYFGATATTLGAAGGVEKETLAASQIPTITSRNATQAISVQPNGVGTNPVPYATSSWSSSSGATGGAFTAPQSAGSIGSTVAFSGANDVNVTSTNTGGASPTPVITVQPTMLATIYVKL